MKKIVRAAGPVVAAAALAGAAGADEWRLSGGAEYSEGDYGAETDTTIVRAPLTFARVAARWGVSVTVPWVSIDGPGVVTAGGGLVGAPGGGGIGGALGGGGLGGGSGPLSGLFDGLLPGAGSEPDEAPAPGGGASEEGFSESGLGDVTAAASVVPYDAGGWRVSLSGGLRAPTGDEERGLGTGEAAGAVSVTLAKRLGRRAAVYGSVGGERAFESGAGGLTAGAGAEGYVSDRTLLGASLAWSEAAGDRIADASLASLYVGYDLTATLQARLYGAAGLTESSPDAAAGARLILKIR